MTTPQIPVTTRYLEQTVPSRPSPPPTLPSGLRIDRVVSPTLSYYRYLFNTIGERWHWAERRMQSDAEVRAIIESPTFLLYVPMVEGNPAGMVEFLGDEHPEYQLKYFGLLPEFIGRGYGLATLQWAVHAVFAQGAARIWLHTCTQDSPNALPVYERAGFTVYEEKEHTVPDPADLGIFGKDRPRYWVG